MHRLISIYIAEGRRLDAYAVEGVDFKAMMRVDTFVQSLPRLHLARTGDQLLGVWYFTHAYEVTSALRACALCIDQFFSSHWVLL